MKIKKITAAVACAALLSSQIGVAAESVKNLPTTGLMDDAKTFSIGSSTTNPDISFAFDLNQGTAFEMASLSDVEMDETEGAWGALGAVGGGGIGAWNYFGNAVGSGSFSWSGLAYSTATGAAIGAVTGPIGISRYYFASRLSGLSGFGYGYGSRSGWW